MNSAFRVCTVTLNPAIDLTVAVENFRPDAVHRVKWSQRHPGGKGVNVASFLADAGLSVAATGFLGQDNEKIFTDFFTRKKIEDSFVRLGGETRIGIKIVDPVTNCTTDLNFPGLKADAADQEKLLAEVEKLAKRSAYMVFSGSLPPEVQPEFYGKLCDVARTAGAKAVVDTSGKALNAAVSAKPSIIKPNIDELSDLAGHRLSGIEEALKFSGDLVKDGIETVIVSLGSEGSFFRNSSEVWFVAAPKIKVVSTVGAGDALLSGYLYSLSQGYAMEKAGKTATAFAAARIEKLAEQLPSLQEIEGRAKTLEARRIE